VIYFLKGLNGHFVTLFRYSDLGVAGHLMIILITTY